MCLCLCKVYQVPTQCPVLVGRPSWPVQWSCPFLCMSLVVGEELRAMELKVTKWLVLGHAAISLGPLSNQTSSLPPWSGFFFLPVPIVAYFMRAVHSKDTKTVGVR